MSLQKKYGNTDNKVTVQLYVLTANAKRITKCYIRTNLLKGTYRTMEHKVTIRYQVCISKQNL